MFPLYYAQAGFVLSLVLAAACESSPPTAGTPAQAGAAAASVAALADNGSDEKQFTRHFRLEDCDFKTVGRNPYLLLVPGRTHILEGEVDGEHVQLKVTVLNETVTIGGIPTRVVEERETHDGDLVEVSRNFFSFCAQNSSVFYFGEDVDFYENGKIVGHEGTWRHGVNGARAGLFMPGIVLLGSRFFQEIAPGVALDRVEIIKLDAVVETPFKTFNNVQVTEESTPLEPGVFENKGYAPGVGLVFDAELLLVAVQGG